MVKTAGIIAGVTAFLGKAWRIIRATKKLKEIKTEVEEAWVEIEDVKERVEDIIKSYEEFRSEDSDGGVKFTFGEAKIIISKQEGFVKDLKEAWKEVKDVQDKVTEVINSIKNK